MADKLAHDLAMTTRRRDLYKAAEGMPFRSDASKIEMAAWLYRYTPDRIPQIPRIEVNHA